MRNIFLIMAAALLILSCKGTSENMELLAKVKYKDKYGFIDTKGNFVIKPQYQMAYSFSNGKAAIVEGADNKTMFLMGGKYGFITPQGETVIEPTFFKTVGYQGDFAVVELDMENFGFINREGHVIKSGFSELYNFNEGLALALDTASGTSPVIGYIDTTGEWQISYEFQKEVLQLGAQFSEGLAVIVKRESADSFVGKTGYINTKGELVIPCSYELGYMFSEGMAAVKVEGKFGFIDKSGAMVVEARYDYAGNFSEGLAAVGINGKYGFIDQKGNVVVEPAYDGTGSFSEGLALIKEGDKLGYVDSTGSVVIPPRFNDAMEFSNGLAAVLDESGKVGYIDKSGNYVIKPKFQVGQGFVKVNETTPPGTL